ncbi:DUF4124 domain-containing protein [Xylophilus sp. Kf1]|nr:DUF4124 domain-containing protein [Xylophilus sp. Kf1]
MPARMRLSGWAAAACLLLACTGAQAQQVFRIVGADGRVTYSDRPAPTTADRAPARSATAVDTPASPAVATATLPYELRMVAQRYPVTLYTAGGCGACDAARSLLRARGVPFLEKTVETAADAEAFQRISGGTGLPYATIGQQALEGFSSVEWTRYLDAAAYPAQSQLPAGYRAPATAPLVAVVPVRNAAPGGTPTGGAASRTAPRAPAAPAAPPANPAGIQF